SLPRVLERLIDPEVRDLKAKRVDANEAVWYRIPHHEIDLGDVGFALALLSRSRRNVPLLEIDRRLVRRLVEFGERHVLDIDVDLIARGLREEVFDDARLFVLCDRRVG